ncbi:MAG: hypothetical protein ACTSPL_04155 [Candidatus Odinarchaeia archaeon]
MKANQKVISAQFSLEDAWNKLSSVIFELKKEKDETKKELLRELEENRKAIVKILKVLEQLVK